MKRVLILVGVLALVISSSAWGFDVQRIAWDQNICATNGDFCLRGNIEYNKKSKNISLNGRIDRSAGPGIVTIWFKGLTSTNKEAVVHMTFRVRGHYSEIVRHSVYTGYWGQVDWRLDEVQFEPLK